ncbi:ligand-binding sensor domain-containing protein [Roseateles oligotrophus]|uniref:diguanylate cyclase n=1 Tax=Roseateles oligotrophus TaxID=1769250 RepID=A0ABT2YJW7_9BURK|nr:ligand-binding sensor domain-containing diguanylate cyclase [Roseateles oligotrophus]MCV2370353.1 diguanylate cyclase [Roseateles oligotrophus]
MNWIRRFSALLLLTATALPSFALPEPVAAVLAEPRFESVGADAIPRGVVASLAQDSAGFIWVGTGDGLVRHDGYRFRPQERSSEIAAERNLGWLRALLPARDGRLWIGTESDGLAVFDPLTGQISSYCFEPNKGRASDQAKTALATITALAEDADGAIWVATLGAGLHRFDPVAKSFRHFRQATGLPDDRVQSLLVDGQGTLWVGGWTGLSRRLKGSDRFESIKGPDAMLVGQLVQSLFQAADGRLWVGTGRGEVAVLDVLDAADGKGRRLPIGGKDRGAINSIVESSDGRVWLGHAAGIDVHEAKSTLLLQQLRHDPLKRGGLAGETVIKLLIDRAGWIWVGGLGLGLQRHNPANQSIWVRSADGPAEPGADRRLFQQANVGALLQLRSGDILAAGRVKGLTQLDAGLQGMRSLPSQGRIGAMAQMADGKVWLATNAEMSQLDGRLRPLRKLAHAGGEARRLLAGSDGSLWLGTSDGLHVLRPSAAGLQRIALPAGEVFAGEVHSLAEAPDHALWVGAMSGLFRLASGETVLRPVASPADAGLGKPSVIGLLFDSKNRLWVDTGVSGLHRMKSWDGALASFERISERHGIVNKPFGANLLEDGRGRIWTQMNVYDPATDRLDELSATDGLDIGTPWFFSYTKTADGRFLFGGSKGVAVVVPELFDRSTYAPPLVVSELRINGERQQVGQLQDGLRLSPQQRSFSLEFAALDYSNPGRSRYAYRLQGFDPGWIETSADLRVASYSNLSPGDYVLRVRAHNRSGVASEQQLAIKVKVLPAWWQQWWFHAALLALVAAAIAALVRWRTGLLRRRQTWLENKVRERTAELEVSSLTDPLTGLRNRRFLAQQIEADVALTLRRHESPKQGDASDDIDLIFFLLDIDHFKQINDLLGHAAGDAVLRQIRVRLQSVFRDSDYLVRWGGEEFLIVARETSRLHAAELAERACRAIAELPFELDDGSHLSKTCSLGFACFPLAPNAQRAIDWNATVNLADAALLAVKRAGRKGWLGVLNAKVDSAQALSERLHQPMADWLASGELELARSAA